MSVDDVECLVTHLTFGAFWCFLVFPLCFIESVRVIVANTSRSLFRGRLFLISPPLFLCSKSEVG